VSEPQPTLFDTLPGTDPQRVLEDVFGYRQFRPGQREIIDAVLAGRDCIGVMPTGAGKSLTFQIPARLLPGAVLVISPLISLMKDQVDALARLGFRATVLNSTVEFEERRRRLAALKRGEVELLYVAPEGLEGSLRSLIAGCSVSLVVVDEAHCISHWGHDFRPSYRRLEGLKQELGDIPVLALTATATRRVAGDIIRQLGMKKPAGFKGSFFRPNLLITAQRKGGAEGAPKRNTRRDILGLVRARHQDAFARDQIDVIVATVAFGMGIDKSNVRYVVHRDMPKSIEAWVQEIGRAGRDGLPSDCVLFYSWADVMGYEAFLDEIADPALREETRRKTVDLFRLVDRGGCRHQKLVGFFDETIEPCGQSCDVCLGRGIEALVVHSPGAPLRGRVSAAAVAEGRFDPELFERLRALRRRLADAEGVPAYIVFSDAVLRQMAEHRPDSRAALLALSGVGPAKLARYGDAFLEALREG